MKPASWRQAETAIKNLSENRWRARPCCYVRRKNDKSLRGDKNSDRSGLHKNDSTKIWRNKSLREIAETVADRAGGLSFAVIGGLLMVAAAKHHMADRCRFAHQGRRMMHQRQKRRQQHRPKRQQSGKAEGMVETERRDNHEARPKLRAIYRKISTGKAI